MTTRETLVAARKLITPEEAWTRSALARNERGFSAEPNSPYATCWCMSGALLRVSGYNYRMFDDACEVLKGQSVRHIAYFNDTHTHVEVLAAFDRAIAACTEEA